VGSQNCPRADVEEEILPSSHCDMPTHNIMDRSHPLGDLPGENMPLNNESFYVIMKRKLAVSENCIISAVAKYVPLSVNSCHHVHWHGAIVIVVALMHSVIQCLFLKLMILLQPEIILAS
jgi:hypothetical protein